MQSRCFFIIRCNPHNLVDSDSNTMCFVAYLTIHMYLTCRALFPTNSCVITVDILSTPLTETLSLSAMLKVTTPLLINK